MIHWQNLSSTSGHLSSLRCNSLKFQPLADRGYFMKRRCNRYPPPTCFLYDICHNMFLFLPSVRGISILAIATEDVDLRPVRQTYSIVDFIPQSRTMNLAAGLDLPPKVSNGANPDPTLFLYILHQGGSDPDPVRNLQSANMRGSGSAIPVASRSWPWLIPSSCTRQPTIIEPFNHPTWFRMAEPLKFIFLYTTF